MTTDTITADNNDKYKDYVKKALAGVDVTMMCQAMERVKDHAYKTEVIGGDVAFFCSARVLKAIEDIKRERETDKENKRKEQLKQ